MSSIIKISEVYNIAEKSYKCKKTNFNNNDDNHEKNNELQYLVAIIIKIKLSNHHKTTAKCQHFQYCTFV